MIEELCRLCGNKNDDMLNIFSEISAEQKLNFKIKEVLKIDIAKEDPLPKLVCLFCTKHLENAFYFINYCHQTQTYLSNLCQKNCTEPCSPDDGDASKISTNREPFNTIKQDSSNLKILSTDKNDDNLQTTASILTDDSDSISNHSNLSKNNTSNLFSDSLNKYSKDFTAEMGCSKSDNSDQFFKSTNERNSSIVTTDLCFENEFINDFHEKSQKYDGHRNHVKRKCKPVGNKDDEILDNFYYSDKNEVSDDSNDFNDDYDGDYEYPSSGKKRTSEKVQPNKSERKTSSTKIGLKHRTSRKSDGNKTTSPKSNKDTKEKKRLSCATCKMTFTQELTYQEHLNVHTGNRPFSCKLCEASFRKRQELNQHLRTIHSEKQFKCPLCDHIAKHKGKLTEHMKSVHEKPFTCDLCNYRTGEKGKIMQHIANKHTGDLSYVCEICGNGFKTKTSLQTHRQNIHFPEPKVCQTCGTVCPSLARYSAHIFRCGKEKKRFPCEKCGKTYVNKEILKDHMNKHLNIKPYKCDVCGKEFFQRNRLDTHKYVHRGAAYRCEICNQSFNRKDNMKNHMKKHFYKSMRYDNMIVTAV